MLEENDILTKYNEELQDIITCLEENEIPENSHLENENKDLRCNLKILLSKYKYVRKQNRFMEKEEERLLEKLTKRLISSRHKII